MKHAMLFTTSEPSRLNQETKRLGNMKAFRVDGQAPFGRLRQKFSLDVVATTKADAEHRVYSIMFSLRGPMGDALLGATVTRRIARS